MGIKTLNIKQMTHLANDILDNNVKRYGTYRYRGLLIKINIDNSHVKNHRQRVLYHEKKLKGICIREGCRVKATHGTVCKRHWELRKENRKNKRLKDGNNNNRG